MRPARPTSATRGTFTTGCSRSVAVTVVFGLTTSKSAIRSPDQTSNRATRAATAGLAVVVVCLAAFSIFGAYTMQTQITRAQHDEALRASYERAIVAVRAEDSSVVEYLLDPTSERRAKMNAAANDLIDAMNDIELFGSDEDGRAALENDLGLPIRPERRDRRKAIDRRDALEDELHASTAAFRMPHAERSGESRCIGRCLPRTDETALDLGRR